MGRGRDAEAQALIDSANAQAQAAQISGQAWGGAVRGIGDIVSQGITEWNSPQARRQRELDDARKVYDEGTRDVRDVMDTRYIAPTVQPSILPGTTPEEGPPFKFTAPAPYAGQEPADMIDRYPEPSLPVLPTSETYGPGLRDPALETITREVRGYLTDDGFFDPRRATSKLVEAGISMNVINELMGELHGNNEMLAAWDALDTKNTDDQTVLFGRLAATVLQQVESGVLDINAGIALNLAPLESRPEFDKGVINDLQVKLFGLSPEQQTATLTDAVKAADNILGYTKMGVGEFNVGELGTILNPAGIGAIAEAENRLSRAIELGDPEAIAAATRHLGDIRNPTGTFQQATTDRQLAQADSNIDLSFQRLAETIRANLVREGYEGQRLEETVAARWQQYGLSIEQLNEVRLAAREREAQGRRGLDQADISQASLDAWRARTAAETERNNREGTAQAIERLRLDAEAIEDRRRESLIRYPPAGQMVTDAQGFTSIPDALESLGLTPTSPEKQLYNRINRWVTGPLSAIPKSGELIGWAQETGATVTALKLVTNVIATALQRNPRLPEGERERVLESLDLMPGLLTNPRSLHTRMRVVDDLLRGMLSGTHALDDQASVLRAIDLLGVPQERARIDVLRVPQGRATADFTSSGEPVR